jgi:hypothetical protein
LAIHLNTGRGPYRLAMVGEAERGPESVAMTLALEQVDGMERVVFRCRIGAQLLGAAPASVAIEPILAALARWIEREFEKTRELALKSIRSERKLMELVFDESNRGPL